MYDFGKQMLVGSEKNACLEKLMSLYMRISICSMSENSFTMGLGANSLTQAFTVVRIFQMLSNNYKAFYSPKYMEIQGCNRKRDWCDRSCTTSFIYSWSIGIILEHEFFCFRPFGQLRAVTKKTSIS